MGNILVLECAIEELPLLAENLEVDMTAANQQYRERLLLQKVKEQQAGYQEQERERCTRPMWLRDVRLREAGGGQAVS